MGVVGIIFLIVGIILLIIGALSAGPVLFFTGVAIAAVGFMIYMLSGFRT